jgi:S-adenosylmethionine/arginine decarboxylase-like enzyme
MKARIWNHRSWVAEVSHRELHALFDPMLRQAGFGLVGFSDAHFQPHGYTAVWILAESHFALHTFPEEGRTYCELSSCNLEKFVALIELIEPHEIA